MNENPGVRTEPDDAPLAASVGRLRAARTADDVVSSARVAVDDAASAVNPSPDRQAFPGAAQQDARRAGLPHPALVAEQGPAVVSDGRGTEPRPGPASDAESLRVRVADRREATTAARQAAAAYAALHGHVPGGDDEELDAASGTRWALRPRTALVATCAVLMLAAGIAVAAAWPRGHVDELAPARVLASAPASAPASGSAAVSSPAPGTAPTPSELVVVDVVGQVHTPGLVTLPAGSRVFDAVAAAGGATEGAELGAINLARPVVDGEQVRVPAPGEVVAPPAQPAGAPAVPGGAPAGGGLVNLNTADEATLDTLPGIGPALAARIVAWRTDNGPFASVDELDEVSGIGPAMLAKVRDLVTV